MLPTCDKCESEPEAIARGPSHIHHRHPPPSHHCSQVLTFHGATDGVFIVDRVARDPARRFVPSPNNIMRLPGGWGTGLERVSIDSGLVAWFLPSTSRFRSSTPLQLIHMNKMCLGSNGWLTTCAIRLNCCDYV